MDPKSLNQHQNLTITKNHTSEIQANKEAWNSLAQDHYQEYKQRLSDPHDRINPFVARELGELGDLRGKSVLHLQCNTGADSIRLARMGARVTGVDFAPDNIRLATKLAEELEISQVEFIQADVLELAQVHQGQYDLIVTFDGVVGWLPDLVRWGKTIGQFIKPDGVFYLHDAHPIFMIFDEEEMDHGRLVPKYPYFDTAPEVDDTIGGYASEPKHKTHYFWGHTLTTIIQGLLAGGMVVTYFQEYDRCVPGMGGRVKDDQGLNYYPEFEGKIPVSLSLMAKPLISQIQNT
jgi:SAM-dependent methyltransferase